MSQQYNPPHPGEVIKDDVSSGGNLSIKQFAEQIGATRAALSRALNGRAAMSPNMALRLADALRATALKVGYTCRQTTFYGNRSKSQDKP